MPESFRRLRITRDVPAPAGPMGVPAAPPLYAGDIVLAFDGPAVVGEAEIAAVIEVGGPWFGVAKNAVEEI
jgi:hypothetical protein